MRIRRVVLGAATLLLVPPLTAAPAAAQPSPAPAGRPIELPGTEVEVSTDTREPTALTAGTWRDTLGPRGSADGTHQFSYRRRIDGSTVFVGVTGAEGETGSDQVSVAISAAGGDECGDDYSSAGANNPFGTFGAQVVAGLEDDPCADVPELRIVVARGTSGDSVADLPVAIRVVEEAPVFGDTGSLPTLPETVRPGPVPRDGEPVATTPGSGYDDSAPLLEPGRYETTVTEGTQAFWRVRLGWGEQLTAQLEVPRQDEATQEVVGGSSPAVELVLADPLLDTFRDEVEDAEGTGAWSTQDDTVLLDGSPPVGWPNRIEGDPATVPGEYWVTVSVAETEDRPPLAVPMTLSVGVEAAESTADALPVFPGDVLSGGSAGPEGYDASTPYLVADGVFAAEVPLPGGTGAARDEAGGATGDPAVSDDAGTVLGLASGAGGVACLLAGLALLARRRRTG